MEIILRDITENDIESIYNISKDCLSKSWTIESYKKEFMNSNAHYLIAMLNDKVIGFGGVWVILDEGQITNIAVSEDFRSNGVGSLLVKGIIEYCNNNSVSFITLEVRESNIAARNLYKRNGFKEDGKRKNYYSDKETAILMSKQLSHSDL